MSDWLMAISNVGFPITMCFYLMLRFEKVLGKMTEAIDRLREKIR